MLKIKSRGSLLEGLPSEGTPKERIHNELTLNLIKTIKAINRGPLKTENNAQALPKQLKHNFEKIKNTTLSIPTIAKNDCLNCQKCAKFLSANLDFGVFYRPLELKKHSIEGL